MNEILDVAIRVVAAIIGFVCVLAAGQMLSFKNVKMIILDTSRVKDKDGLCIWVGFGIISIPVVTFVYIALLKVNKHILIPWIIGWIVLMGIIIYVIIKGAQRYTKHD